MMIFIYMQLICSKPVESWAAVPIYSIYLL